MNVEKLIKFSRVAFAFLFGAALMCYALYGWHEEWLDDWQALIVGTIGFAFMYFPQKLEAVISKGLSRIFDATIGRFFNGGGKATMLALMVLSSFAVNAQYYNAKAYRVVHDNDSSGITGVGIIRWDRNTGKFRFWDGDSWISFRKDTDIIGGASLIGTINGTTKSADGAVISGSTLYMQTADETYPGLVSTGTQKIAGEKEFTGSIGIGVNPVEKLHVFRGSSNGVIARFEGGASSYSTFIEHNATNTRIYNNLSRGFILAPNSVNVYSFAPDGTFIINAPDVTAQTLLQKSGTNQWAYGIDVGEATENFNLYNYGTSSIALKITKVGNNMTLAGVGTATDWVATSDRRLKENAKPVGSQLEKVEAIAGLVRNYDRTDNQKNETGFIAQELAEVAPEYVNGGNDSVMWSVNYSKMVVPLYKAVAELTERVVALEKENASLRKQTLDAAARRAHRNKYIKLFEEAGAESKRKTIR